ncbi:zinc finger and SCAN domain-containing protein 2-like [Pelmatolapia mariae]|uniref:zinc finger and SCAN domain-containing protein 2-like n=1 Tax=Pelmatolapia mariae TaxID=158779 RepID=UPI002FE61C6A
MPSVQYLREFINERLTAAAEQIFLEFEKTIVQYEEEIDRQRRLLDITWKPQIKLHRTDVPQQRVCEDKEEEEEEEEVLSEQQLWNQERSSSLDQEEPEPPQIKEEQEELCSSQEGEQLGLKEETDTFMVTAAEEGEHSEPEADSEQLPSLSSDNFFYTKPKDTENIRNSFQYQEEINHQQRQLAVTWKPEIKLDRIDAPQEHVCKEEEEILPEQQLWNQDRSSSLDQEEPEPPQIKEEQEELCSSQEGEQLGLKEETDTFMVTAAEERDHSEPEAGSDQLITNTSYLAVSHDQEGSTNDAQNFPQSQSNTNTGKKSLKCDGCRKSFTHKSRLTLHNRIHTGEKLFLCTTCGKRCSLKDPLLDRVTVQAAKTTHLCKTCGKMFSNASLLKRHKIIHSDEKQYSCKTCGKGFHYKHHLVVHLRVHTGEKPYICKTCDKRFTASSSLKKHSWLHSGETPYSCKTCGKAFATTSSFTLHSRIHTGDKPYSCKTCGKSFSTKSWLKIHSRSHSGEKPYSCKTWEKFPSKSI